MKQKINLWYESNACWGFVETLKDLQKKCKRQIDPEYGALKDVDEFLDRSRQHNNGNLNFGTRIEHTGKKSLRKYLAEKTMIEAFLSL